MSKFGIWLNTLHQWCRTEMITRGLLKGDGVTRREAAGAALKGVGSNW